MLFSHEEADPARLTRSPPRSLIALAALAAGFIVARQVPYVPSEMGFGVCGVLVSVAMASRRWVCRVAMVLAVVAFGFGYFTFRVHEVPRTFLMNRLPASGGQLIKVEGIVLDTPRADHPPRDPLNPQLMGGPSLHFDLETTRLIGDANTEPASGALWVRVASPGPNDSLHAGDRVVLTGMLEPLNAPMNPGEVDRRLYGAQDGRIGWLRMSGPGLIEHRPEPESLPEVVESMWLRSRAWLSDRAHAVLLGDAPKVRGRDAPDPGRAVLAAPILGDEDRGLRDVRGAFNRLGLAHVLSISGFHLAVMVGVVLLLLRAWGDLGRAEPLITGALVLLYLAILPFNAPVWRSGLMVLGLLAGDALGRRYDRLTILGWIAVILLLYRPLDAWSMGFQLSFGLVALLIWQGEAFHGRLFGVKLRGTVPDPEPGLGGWLLDSVKHLTSTSILCGLTATPIVAYHTGLVSPAAILSSILLVPPIAALLIAGYIVLLIGVLAPPLNDAATVLGVLSNWTTALVQWFDAIPGTSVRVPSISLALAVFATVVILYWIVRGYKRDLLAWTLAIAAALWTASEFRLSPTLPRTTLARVDTLAVGDGTCHLIRSGREAMLWDCGSLTPGVGQMLVPRAVRNLGAYRVPTVLVTHPNLDHFNGLIDVAEPLGVKLLVTGQAVAERAETHPHSGEAFLFSELRKRGVQIRIVSAGDRLDLGDVVLEFISPPRDAGWTADNDWSLVARLVPKAGAKDKSTPMLLCGDIEAPAIDGIKAAHPDLHPLVMEAPHHGSAKEAGIGFVAALDPKIILQSTGPQRANDMRWKEVREQRLWYCTTLNGAAWVELERDGSVKSGAMGDDVPRSP